MKPRSLKFQQDSGAWGMQFVVFNDSVHEEIKPRVMRHKTTKAISIVAVSQEKFLILDSNGGLHILHVSKTGSSRMSQLTSTIQVQQLATFPDASAGVLLVIFMHVFCWKYLPLFSRSLKPCPLIRSL